MAGATIGIDPGHDGGNFTHTAYIDHLIWNGREREACNTTGTETDSGYPEALYNWRVANFLAADIRQAGGRVIMTRHTNQGVGPCVNSRAHILDHAHVNVAIDIHADGGPARGRGFALLVPVPDGINNSVVGESRIYAHDLRTAFERGTGMPTSNYDGVDGIQPRSDLAGLNLTTVPQVLIECGNMRNATDAKLLISTSFQRHAARAIESAMNSFLEGGKRHP